MDHRLAAAKVLLNVLDGASLSAALPKGLEPLAEKRRPAAQALVYGVLRHFEKLKALSGLLLKKPFKPKDKIVFALLLVGLFELRDKKTATHAVVNELVKVVKKQRQWAGGLVNACLRRYQRETEVLENAILQQEPAKYGLPQWWLDRLQEAWPEQWESIAAQFSLAAPMTLRVNLDRVSRDDYRSQLLELGIDSHVHPLVASALELAAPVDVAELPGFADGLVSVQDAAAQLAGWLLDVQPGQRVLDACAAPGGKMAHLLEQANGDLQMSAVEFDPVRAEKLSDTLKRLQYSADVIVADAGDIQRWWQGEKFDRILLDAPCSATGTVRRNPDVKRHRKAADIDELVTTQVMLLNRLWEVLKPGGLMVYATCSIMPQENEEQIRAFVNSHGDAESLDFEADWGHSVGLGRQILPGEFGMDGFYYACMRKQ